MESSEALERTLKSFERYYSVRRRGGGDEVAEPFAAEAEFRSTTEQYFLVRAARLSRADSNENVFFHVCGRLDCGALEALAERAWGEGISRVRPDFGHRNTDVTLVILSDSICDDAFRGCLVSF